MLTSPCITFELLIRNQRIPSVPTHNAVSNRHPWINGPFTHVMFFWTNLNFWPPHYPVLVTPTINICIKGKINVFSPFSFFLSLSLSFVAFFFLVIHYPNIYRVSPHSWSATNRKYSSITQFLYIILFQAEEFLSFRTFYMWELFHPFSPSSLILFPVSIVVSSHKWNDSCGV